MTATRPATAGTSIGLGRRGALKAPSTDDRTCCARSPGACSGSRPPSSTPPTAAGPTAPASRSAVTRRPRPSMVEIMVALWFHELTNLDRVAVKPHASPVLHAINYLLGDLDAKYLTTLREKGGLQSYPSRIKDPDTVDFSTGSVGIGATAPLWAAFAHRYIRSQFADAPPAGRFISLLGDAELDEGAIWEAVADPSVAQLGELLWVVDLNRQSLDRVVPDIQIERLQGMFGSAGWEVITLKWGRRIGELFDRARRRRAAQPARADAQRGVPAHAAGRPVGRGRAILVGPTPAARAAGAGGTAVRSTTLPPRSATSAATTSGCSSTPSRAADDRAAPPSFSPTRSRAADCRPRDTRTTTPPCSPRPRCDALADASGVDLGRPVATVPGRAAPDRPVHAPARAAAPPVPDPHTPAGRAPTALGHAHRKPLSTQAALGRLLADLEARRAGNRGAGRHLQPRRRVVDEPRRLDQQDRRLVRADRPRLVRRRHRTGPALVTRCRAGQHIELGIAEVNLVCLLGELGRHLVALGRAADPDRHASTTRSSPGPWSRGPTASTPAVSPSSSAPHRGSPSRPRAEPTSRSSPLDRARAARLRRLGTRLRPRPGVVLPARDVADRQSRAARRPTSGCAPGPSIPALAASPRTRCCAERRRRQAIAGGYRLSRPPRGRGRRDARRRRRDHARGPRGSRAPRDARRPRRRRLPDQSRPGVPVAPATRPRAPAGRQRHPRPAVPRPTRRRRW